MSFTDTELILLLESWLWPFFRIAGLTMTAPVIGTRTVPVRIRMVLALAITAAIVPVLPAPPAVDPLSGEGLYISIQQVLIGAALGLTLRFVFIVLEVAGQVIAQQMGLGFAAMVDPQSGAQVPVVSQFYLILMTLAFLAINGHLVLIRILAGSFDTMPVGDHGITRDGLWQLVHWAGWLLANAVLIALPAIVALLVINISFGVMSRAAPQLNIFAVGFPIMILLGTGVMLLTLSAIEPHFMQLFDKSFVLASQLVART